MYRRFIRPLVFTCSFAASVAVAQGNLLQNAGFESPDASGGDVSGAPGTPWSGFNDPGLRYTISNPSLVHSGSQSLKTFGPWNIGGGVGATQTFAAAPGDIFSGEVWALNAAVDAIQGGNFGVYKIEFYNSSNQLAAGGVAGVDVFESNQINASSPQDVWTLLGTGGVAPAGTAYGQVVIVGVQIGDGTTPAGGSIFWDDASVTLVPEPATMALLGLGGLVLVARRRVA